MIYCCGLNAEGKVRNDDHLEKSYASQRFWLVRWQRGENKNCCLLVAPTAFQNYWIKYFNFPNFNYFACATAVLNPTNLFFLRESHFIFTNNIFINDIFVRIFENNIRRFYRHFASTFGDPLSDDILSFCNSRLFVKPPCRSNVQ